jgi:hypothetical protein
MGRVRVGVEVEAIIFYMMSHKKIILAAIFLLMAIWSETSRAEVSVESLLPKDIRKGWTLASGPQTYTKKTLFEHVNGQAELFFKYGFQKSAFAVYQEKKNPKNQIDLDIYDVGNVLQAFGIFSRFRNEDRPAGIGLDSYLDDHSLLFYQGRYFVMLYAVESNLSILKELGMTVSSKILGPSLPPKEIGYFPKGGLKPGSIQYYTEGLMGHQFLKRGFQGTYVDKVEAQVKDEDKAKAKVEVKAEVEEKEFSLFLAIFKDSQDVENALKIYRDDLSKKGKVGSEVSTPFGPNALKGEDPYRGKVIVVPKEFYLAGIVGFENLKSAEKLLEEFVKNIR